MAVHPQESAAHVVILFYERCPGTVVGHNLYVCACVSVMSVWGVISPPMSKQHNTRVNTCYCAASSLWTALCQRVLFRLILPDLFRITMGTSNIDLRDVNVVICRHADVLQITKWMLVLKRTCVRRSAHIYTTHSYFLFLPFSFWLFQQTQ